MKKIIATLLIFTLCIGLCACGGGDHVELPTRPPQSAPQNQPAVQENQNAEPGETQKSTEAIESTEGKYPWEVEFREEDYFVYTHTEPKVGKFTSYLEGNLFGRCVRTVSEYTNGEISDAYFYPNGVDSHSYTWYADGSYIERHHLDDGRIDLEERKTYLGTTVYYKQINPNGTWNETHCDENGNVIYSGSLDADGTLLEYQRLEDGTSREVSDNPNTGCHSEWEYYTNGNTKKSISDNPEAGTYSEYECYENGNIKYSVSKDAAGNYSEQEYYENGNFKCCKNQSPEYTMAERYDEEGYRTYFYQKDVNWEIELTADETGKLVKVVENGEVKEDAATLAQYAQNYNFRE